MRTKIMNNNSKIKINFLMEIKNNINSQNKEKDSINYCKFNQDNSFILLGTQTGYKIINCNPFKNFIQRKLGGGIGIIDMLNNSNIIGLTGQGENSKYSQNQLIIYDHIKKKEIAEIHFVSKIKNVKFSNDKLFVICEKKINIFDFDSLELKESFNISHSKIELISISTNKFSQIAFLKDKTGNIFIKNYRSNKVLEINMREEKIQFLCFNHKGDVLAAINESGKDMKLFDTSSGKIIKKIEIDEYTNNNYNLKVDGISFNKSGTLIGISFIDKEEKKFLLDIYKIDNENNNNNNEINFWNYFITANKKRFANFSLVSKKSIFNFDINDNIIVVSYEGKFYRIVFDKDKGGECKIIEKKDIF